MIDKEVLVQQHRREKEDSARFKMRRLEQWNDNYFLYRDKTTINRLTQRQPVNIPVTRETIQSWVSKIDEQPKLRFEARGRSKRDKRGELYVNEMWDVNAEMEQLDLKDNLEKKIVGLQGRTFKHLHFQENHVKIDIIDPYDVDIDPRVNPFNLNTASYLNHKNIFIPLRRILANKTYKPEAKLELKIYLDSKQGIISAAQNENENAMRKLRLETLGASNYDEYRASDVMIELNRSYKLIWDDVEKKFIRYLLVFALDSILLYAEPLKKAVGIDFLPWVSWASDPDLNDIWSDGIADSVRTVNKVVNMYFSQDLENRAYRNFGMYFFNNQNSNFQPQAFEARPFGMYGVPGNPDEVIKQMKIEPLQDTTSAIEYLKNMIQSSVAQTPTERGEQLKSRTTYGEVQISLAQSKARNEVVAKQYRLAWQDTGRIWYELMKANQIGNVTLYKKAKNGQNFSKTIAPAEWKVPEGYEAKAVYQSEQEQNDDLEFRKLQFVKNSFINNPIALRIARRKELEILGWDPDEIDEVMMAEEQTPTPAMNPADPSQAGAAGAPAQPSSAPNPVQTQEQLSLTQPTQ